MAASTAHGVWNGLYPSDALADWWGMTVITDLSSDFDGTRRLERVAILPNDNLTARAVDGAECLTLRPAARPVSVMVGFLAFFWMGIEGLFVRRCGIC